MLTKGQIKALHVAAHQAGVSEEERRLVQRNIGGFHSAADRTATRKGFIACMAFYESKCNGQLGGSAQGYWTREDGQANSTDALLFTARAWGRLIGMNDATLSRFLAGPHMSAGAYVEIAAAPAYWLSRVIEALKVMRRRAIKAQGRMI